MGILTGLYKQQNTQIIVCYGQGEIFLPYASLKIWCGAIIHLYLSYAILTLGNTNASLLNKTILTAS